MIESIQSWCNEHKIQIKEIVENYVYQNDKTVFFIASSKDVARTEESPEWVLKSLLSEDQLKETFTIQSNILFDIDMCLFIDDVEQDLIDQYKCTHYLYYFGGQYYIHPINNQHKLSKSIEFKYWGKVEQDVELPIAYLGIRGGYEILNGSGTYSNWIRKAKFYEHTTLGICEKNTLAGTLAFQLACKSNDIQYIIGETVTVMIEEERFTDVKLYVVNNKGWKNLLQLNKILNVDRVVNEQQKYVEIDQLFYLSDGLIIIWPSGEELDELLIEQSIHCFDKVYLQIDPVQLTADDLDIERLQNIKNNLNLIDIIEPILICDSFYIDKQDAHIKSILNTISGKKEVHSEDQYYKNIDDIFIELLLLIPEDKIFKNGDTSDEFLSRLIDNTLELAKSCQFQ